MKKIKRKDIGGLAAKGWLIDKDNQAIINDIKFAEILDRVAKASTLSTEVNSESVSALEAMTRAISKMETTQPAIQNSTVTQPKEVQKVEVVHMPEVMEAEEPKAWKFAIKRDNNNLIKEVIVTQELA